MAKNQRDQPDAAAGDVFVPSESNSSPESEPSAEWCPDSDGNWCNSTQCYTFKIPGAGSDGEIQVEFDESCPDEVVDAVYFATRKGKATNYNLRGGS